MLKCCICGKEISRPSLWACPECYKKYDLALAVENWPEWVKSEMAREKRRRRYSPSYGVSSSELSYAPYRRKTENKTYRKSNHVRQNGSKVISRIGADNILYSTRDDESRYERSLGYHRVLESMPSDLRERLRKNVEFEMIVADAIKALPLISQRAIKGYLGGHSEADIAASEGISQTTMHWLLSEAKERLKDLLAAKIGADDGTRYG